MCVTLYVGLRRRTEFSVCVASTAVVVAADIDVAVAANVAVVVASLLLLYIDGQVANAVRRTRRALCCWGVQYTHVCAVAAVAVPDTYCEGFFAA